MLFQTPELEATELRAIQRIQKLKDSLAYVVGGAPRRWQGLLRRSALARAIRGSNSIEGYEIALDDAMAVAIGEPPLSAEADALTAVQGYQSAMTYILQLAADPEFTYSNTLVRSLQFMMIQHDLSKNPGRWRPGQIFVRDDEQQAVVYEGPPAEDVSELMTELMHQLNTVNAVPPVVRAAMGHLNLVMIHPFSDGNGRMARCLQTLILARAGTLAPQFSSIEEYLGANTQDYYRVLAAVGAGAWNPQRDARPWIRFNLTAHFRQATTLLRRARELERLWDELDVELRKSELPDRTIFALADAALGWRVRNGTYRPHAELSDQVAGRDLALCVRAGFLLPKGEKRGRFYVAAPQLAAIRDRTRESRSVHDDPFAEVADATVRRALGNADEP